MALEIKRDHIVNFTFHLKTRKNATSLQQFDRVPQKSKMTNSRHLENRQTAIAYLLVTCYLRLMGYVAVSFECPYRASVDPACS